MDRLDKLISLFHQKDEESWCRVLCEIAYGYGFEHVLVGILPSHSTQFDKAFLKSNFPDQWRKVYDVEKLHYADPTVLHVMGSIIPIAWKPESFTGSDQQAFYERACEYKLRSGICYPIRGAAGEIGMLSLVSGDIDHVAKNQSFEALAQLSLIRDYALESAVKFQDTSTVCDGDSKLTKREMECLKWIMIGKTSWEISKILYCSEDNVKFHAKNIIRKLNVNSRQQAVVKAIKLGLITPP